MAALANASLLRKDALFREWVETAVVFVASEVLKGDSAAPDEEEPVRRKLAIEAVVQPGNSANYFMTLILGDSQVNGTYTSATPGALEGIIITKVQNFWTGVARIIYPEQ